MKESQHRFVGLASILLVGVATFAACGGLDPRKVSQGPRYMSGGDSSEAGGPGTSSGGSEARGGDTGNPFGGQLFAGGSPPVLEGPPEVVEVDPLDMATDVDVDTSVSLLFSEAIDPATVTTDSVQVLDRGELLAGDVSMDPNSIIASFEPSRRLALAASYDVTVSTAVTDTTGTALKEAFASKFSTRDGTWDEVDSPFVEDPATNWGFYSQAKMGIDDRGNVLVVWTQADPVTYSFQVWGRWHRQTTGWQDAVQLSAAPSGTSQYPEVAVSPEGDAVAVWSQYNGVTTASEITARRYINGAWSDAPENATGNATTVNGVNNGPFVKMRGGKVVLWWTQYYYSGNYTYYYMYAQSAATYDGPWLASPVNLDYANSAGGYLGRSAMAMDPAGNGMLIHGVYNVADGTSELQFSKYIAATNDWEYPATLTVATDVYYYDPFSVALDNSGAAMVVWRNTTAPYDLWASRYTKAKGFAAAVPLEELDTPPELHYTDALATDGTDFFVTWAQSVGSTRNAYGAHFSTAAGAWDATTLISDGDTGLAYSMPSTSADPHGNAMAIWLQGSYNQTTMYDDVQYRFARYRADTMAWAPHELLWGPHNYDSNGNYSAAAGNGIVAALTINYGIYDANDPNADPQQPFLNIFQ